MQLGWKQVFPVTLPLSPAPRPVPLFPPWVVSQQLPASALQKLQKVKRLDAHDPESGGKVSTHHSPPVSQADAGDLWAQAFPTATPHPKLGFRTQAGAGAQGSSVLRGQGVWSLVYTCEKGRLLKTVQRCGRHSRPQINNDPSFQAQQGLTMNLTQGAQVLSYRSPSTLPPLPGRDPS